MAGEKFEFSAEYLKWLPRFLFHADFVDGQRESVKKYLVPHNSELSDGIDPKTGNQVGNQGLQVRVSRLENDNLCEPVLMYWLGYFSQAISLKDAFSQGNWPDILADLDGEDMDYQTFVRHLFWNLTGLGRIGALVEGPTSTAQSAADALAMGERSYVSLWEPSRICKLERFKEFGPMKGKLRELAIIESTERGETDSDRKTNIRRFWIEQQGGNYKSQRIQVKGDVLSATTGADLYVDKAYTEPQDLLAAGPVLEGAFNEIPFVILGTNPKEDSVVYSVVPKNREHLNKKSACDNNDYYQCFRMLFGFGIDPKEINYATERNMILVNNPDGKVVAIEPGDSTILHAELDKIEAQASMAGTIEVVQKHQAVSKQVESAENQREKKSAFFEYLNYMTDRVEKSVNRVFYFLWWFEQGAAPAKGTYEAEIDRNFPTAPTDQELADEQLMFQMLDDFGKPGREIKAEILANKVMTRNFTAMDSKTQEKRKQELIEALRKEALKEPVNPLGDIEARMMARRGLPGQQPEQEQEPSDIAA